jgi:hypothetical protein
MARRMAIDYLNFTCSMNMERKLKKLFNEKTKSVRNKIWAAKKLTALF